MLWGDLKSEILASGFTGAMMRRPNRRLSSEYAPGPSRANEIAYMTDNPRKGHWEKPTPHMTQSSIRQHSVDISGVRTPKIKGTTTMAMADILHIGNTVGQ